MDFKKIYILSTSRILGMLAITIISCLQTNATTHVKLSLDSAAILMGKTTSLHFLIDSEEENIGQFTLALDSIPKEIEIVTEGKPSYTKDKLGNGHFQFKGQYIIQSFDSGDYRIPGLIYVTQELDTIISNPVNLKVIPVDVDAEGDINSDATPMNPGKHFFDWIPAWWPWATGAIAVIVLGVIAYLLLSKKIEIKRPQKKPEPPYNVARRELDRIRVEKAWEALPDKAYYSRITDIFRKYISGLYGINAMEMTTYEILEAISQLSLTEEQSANIKNLLTTSDFVKFAKLKASIEENINAFATVENFVESTRPIVYTQQSVDSVNNDTKTVEK